MAYRRHHRRFTSDQKAFLFGLVMFCVLILSVTTALSSTGPIVLGTEKNTNGLVEYLCL